jgi:hypothetical protein
MEMSGGRKGWRLPAIAELMNLIDPSVLFPSLSLPPGHPFLNVQSASYWSATTVADNPSSVWAVSVSGGFVVTSGKELSNHVWCVRGGMEETVYRSLGD